MATKVGNPHGCPPGERPLSRAQVALHLEASLRRLGLERIGLYYLHEFDPATPLEETLEALDRALAAGKIAVFGVSNASRADLDTVARLAGEGPLRAAFTHVQNEFSLLVQRDLADVVPRAAELGLAYAAFSPLAGGLLTGKYRPGEAPGLRNAPRGRARPLRAAADATGVRGHRRADTPGRRAMVGQPPPPRCASSSTRPASPS